MDAPAGSCLVVFLSTRSDGGDLQYAELAARMAALVAQQPGYIGSVSVRDERSREGITVAIFAREADALAWKQVAEHRIAQQAGRTVLYDDYQVIVAQITRSYRA